MPYSFLSRLFPRQNLSYVLGLGELVVSGWKITFVDKLAFGIMRKDEARVNSSAKIIFFVRASICSLLC